MHKGGEIIDQKSELRSLITTILEKTVKSKLSIPWYITFHIVLGKNI